jgi:exopolysaccharide biosynthesis polyprenyl glycosylphosphotransferase
MSSPLFNQGRQQIPTGEWAVRLIPGIASDADKHNKKQSAWVRLNDIPKTNEILLAPAINIKNLNTPTSLTLRASTSQKPPLNCSLHEKTQRNILIVGAGGFGRRVASCIESHPEEGRVVCGFLDDERPLGNGIIGPTSSLARISRTAFVDEIILAAPHDRALNLRVLHQARRLHLDVEMAVDLFGCEPAQTAVRRVEDLPVICLHREALPAAQLLAKRVVDIVGASIGLIFLAPVFSLIAGLIKWDSPGPVIYSAPRIGRKGKSFRCYKFRTMVTNADDLKSGLRQRNERSGAFKIAHDPRITRVGRWLRRYSLDELPQLCNVLRREMSLVGPRPHPLDDFAAYGVEHLARLDVTPGITGLWQVTARRNPSFEIGMELDRKYIEAWNLVMDLRILFKTILAVFRGSGV